MASNRPRAFAHLDVKSRLILCESTSRTRTPFAMRILRSSNLLHHMHPYFDLSLAATMSFALWTAILKRRTLLFSTPMNIFQVRPRVGWRDLLPTLQDSVIAFCIAVGSSEPYTAFRVPVGFAKRSSDFCLKKLLQMTRWPIDDSASSGKWSTLIDNF
jgi:hypothetical protein